jgi:hypothetical protein
MSQQFLVPDDDDFVWVAQQWIAASQFAESCGARPLDGELGTLVSIQLAVDSLSPTPESVDLARALGLAFGRVFIENNPGYDWWIVEDDYGRDICVRYRETSIAAFPGEMFANRFEDQEAIDVQGLYRGLSEALDEVHAASGGGV